jgi:hypothetical protein
MITSTTSTHINQITNQFWRFHVVVNRLFLNIPIYIYFLHNLKKKKCNIYSNNINKAKLFITKITTLSPNNYLDLCHLCFILSDLKCYGSAMSSSKSNFWSANEKEKWKNSKKKNKLSNLQNMFFFFFFSMWTSLAFKAYNFFLFLVHFKWFKVL